MNNLDEPWFNIFSVVFEIVSAYGTVGLSLGSSNANFSSVNTMMPCDVVSNRSALTIKQAIGQFQGHQ